VAISVRSEERSDRLVVRDVVIAAFGRVDEADLVDRLRLDGDAALSLVAEEAGRIVGHVLFSPMPAPFRALGLAPVSVLPERQRVGIGSLLIRAGLARAEQEGWRGVFVLGEPEFYRRFGFEPSLAAGFQCAYAGPYLMARGLGGSLPAAGGALAYARAFQAVGS